MNEQASFSSADERMHRFDPSDWSWNESWYFSWIDLAGGPAGFLRVGVLPNQGRAILWCYVHRDGVWLGTEETRLALDDIDLANGLSYDKWALRLAWHADPPLGGGRLHFAGVLRVLTGPEAGSLAPVTFDLAVTSTSDCERCAASRARSHTTMPSGRSRRHASASRRKAATASTSRSCRSHRA
jgi:hypothetical protein